MKLYPLLLITTVGAIDKRHLDALSEYEITDSFVSKLTTIARVARAIEICEAFKKDSLDVPKAIGRQLGTSCVQLQQRKWSLITGQTQ
jgi:hypothetical protein